MISLSYKQADPSYTVESATRVTFPDFSFLLGVGKTLLQPDRHVRKKKIGGDRLQINPILGSLETMEDARDRAR